MNKEDKLRDECLQEVCLILEKYQKKGLTGAHCLSVLGRIVSQSIASTPDSKKLLDTFLQCFLLDYECSLRDKK